MRIVLPSVDARAAGALVYDAIKAWAKPVHVAFLGTCVCLAFITGFFFYKIEVSRREKSIGQPRYVGVPQVIGKGDEKFLDDLFQQQNQKGEREKNPEAKISNDVTTAQSDTKPVRRAELIVNTSRVKRAELVVNKRVLERGELVRPKLQ
jgi:hypothetical protein